MKKFMSIVLITILIASLSGCGNSASSFSNQVQNGNYLDAIDIYKNNILGNIEKENAANSFLQNFLDQSWTNYIDGAIDEQEFINNYSTVEKINNELHMVQGVYEIYQQYQYIKESKENYTKAVDCSNNGDLESAINAFSLVVPEDTENYDNAQEKLSEVTNEYQEQMISNAMQLSESDKFEEAIMCINQAEVVVGPTTELENCLSDIYTRKYVDMMNNAFDSEDYLTVIKIYPEACSNNYTVISSDMTSQYYLSITKYSEGIYEKAESAFGSDKDYSAAISVLQDAIFQVENNEELISQFTQRINYYQEYIPIYLTSLKYIQKAEYIDVGGAYGDDLKDVNGNLYEAETVISPSGGFLASDYATSDDEAYVLYNLNYNYSNLSGTIYRPYRSLSFTGNWNSGASVRIYGDDILLYEEIVTGDTYDSVDFEINVAGVRNLKIVMRGVWADSTNFIGLYSRYPGICMAEAILQK